jgi:hypothetical protein
MSRTVNLGLVDTDELSRVFDTLWMLRSEGHDTPGVVVFCEEGRRRWLMSGDNLSILVTGDAIDFPGAYRLPLTVVANAGRQGAANGPVTYTIEGDVVTAESARGRQSVSCSSVSIPRVDRVALTRSRASATLTGRDLVWVAFSGANDPFESASFDDEDERQAPDHFTITIADGLLTVSSDWTKAKLYPMLGATSATTEGHGEVRVEKAFINVLFNCIDADSEWTIAFDPKEPGSIVLQSDASYIVANMVRLPAAQLHTRARKILDREKIEYQVAGNGAIGVRLDGVVVSLHFYGREGGDTPLLALSTILVEGANESAELLHEINAHNRNASGTRCWFDDGNVRLGLELLPDNLHVLASRLAHLVNDARRLTGVLEPFAAEAPIAVPRRDRQQSNQGAHPEMWD